MSKGKVFCRECKHIQDDYTRDICSHPNNYVDNSFESKGKMVSSIEKRNEKNDCKDFEQVKYGWFGIRKTG